MTTDVSATAVDGSTRKARSEAEWRSLMADFERWDGTQASFCEARGGVAEVVSELAPQERLHCRSGRGQVRRLCQNRGSAQAGLGCRAVARRRGRAPSAAVLMLGGWPAGGIWLSTEPTDMRRSFDGLCALVSTHLGENPASGRWYVFVNRRRTMVKVLGFEHGGFFIWAKRLEQDLFASPPVLAPGQAALSLSRTELSALLEGIDITVRRHRKRYDAPFAVAA